MQYYEINNYLTKFFTHRPVLARNTDTLYTILRLWKLDGAHNSAVAEATWCTQFHACGNYLTIHITTEHTFHACGRQDNSCFVEGTQFHTLGKHIFLLLRDKDNTIVCLQSSALWCIKQLIHKVIPKQSFAQSIDTSFWALEDHAHIALCQRLCYNSVPAETIQGTQFHARGRHTFLHSI